jgi:hypothetical protein
MQAPLGYSVLNGLGTEAQVEELPPGYNTVLLLRQAPCASTC